jgi:hypothetical protein
MSDAKHTLGPWYITASDPEGIVYSADDTLIVPHQPIGYTTEVQWANARLIASAPALLEALEALQLDLENNGEVYVTDYARLAVIKDALALAKKEVSNASST